MLFFKKTTNIDKYLRCQLTVSPKQRPHKLVNSINSFNQKQLQKFQKTLFHEIQKGGLQKIRSLTLINHLILNTNKIQNKVPQILYKFDKHGQDSWLQRQIIKPYLNYLKKCSKTQQLFELCKSCQFAGFSDKVDKNDITNLVFYSINLLQLLLKCVKEIELFGKYFVRKNKILCNQFIEIIGFQAELLYSIQKQIIENQQLREEKFFEELFKTLRVTQYVNIQRQMKNLFFFNEFELYKKGYSHSIFIVVGQNNQYISNLKQIQDKTIDKLAEQDLGTQENLFNKNTKLMFQEQVQNVTTRRRQNQKRLSTIQQQKLGNEQDKNNKKQLMNNQIEDYVEIQIINPELMSK